MDLGVTGFHGHDFEIRFILTPQEHIAFH